jgi:GTP diphosphokinase / guanosine-3',5'-bis(diphosphate) 3'-diphosphatase
MARSRDLPKNGLSRPDAPRTESQVASSPAALRRLAAPADAVVVALPGAENVPAATGTAGGDVPAAGEPVPATGQTDPAAESAAAAAPGALPKRSKPLIRQLDLVDKVRQYNPNTDEDLLNRAYVYAMKKHGSQLRRSGDPYISHPLEVAWILTDHQLDDATIVAALLHDTIEDTDTTRGEIEDLFGRDIGRLVDGLTKLKKLDLVSREAKQAENLRKLLLAIAEDVRVLLVKLADRLHNMRTIEHMKPESAHRIAQETIDIYAPLAGRIGMHEMREELEELSFRVLKPEAHKVISTRLDELEGRNRGLISEIEAQLARKLATRGITAMVKGRGKRPYSVWCKMERKAVGFEQLSDIYGFRILVKSMPECYQALGVVHTTWPVVPGRFKDYISTPKQNEYQSIHTTVIGPGNQRVELQIRTEEMHEVAEYGIAAHSLYKDQDRGAGELLSRERKAYGWLRRTIELLAEGENPEEFLEHTKLELFQDQVFCFTPKGMLIALPRDATPIDFAYAVHTDVGNHAVGCKINGRMAPLASPLQNGDEVEILTSNAHVAPPAAWESLVATGRARAAMRRATRQAVRSQYAELGRRIVERMCQRAKREYSDESLTGALPRLARKSLEDVFAAVGRGDMKASNVIRAMYPDYKEERAAAPGAPGGPPRRAPPPLGGAGLVRSRYRQGDEVQGAGRHRQGLSADPRHQLQPAGPLRARRRRGAGRPHRRHPDAGRRNHDLPDPVPGAEGFRGHPRPLARRALGRGPRRRRPAPSLPRPHRAAIGQRAGHAGADRSGDRRSRRQHRQHPHEPAVAGLHVGNDRSRSLRPQAPHRHHRAAAREARGGEGGAGERVNVYDSAMMECRITYACRGRRLPTPVELVSR